MGLVAAEGEHAQFAEKARTLGEFGSGLGRIADAVEDAGLLGLRNLKSTHYDSRGQALGWGSGS
jgi:hypothetical protein